MYVVTVTRPGSGALRARHYAESPDYAETLAGWLRDGYECDRVTVRPAGPLEARRARLALAEAPDLEPLR